VRTAPAVAAGLAAAAVGMAVLAFATGGDGEERAAAPSATPAATTAQARDGLEVWIQQGCGSCHALAAANAHAPMGPDLDVNLEGVPAAYIEESIVAPDKHVAPGYSAGIMPPDYAKRIAPDDLDRLVAFLQGSAGR
jgi:mono/diheme cytochrome c family protein